MTTPDNSGTHATLADSGDNSKSQDLPRGSNLGRYVIIEPIGSGGMGTVYRAYDPQLNRGVALKILSVKQDDFQAAERAKARLIREAQALAQLSHPNVVAVHDAGTFEDDVFIAMELVEGKTLDDWMKEAKRSVKEILGVMIAAGRGLSAAHNAGLVHRDFKPGNVIVGDDRRVRVLDFGLARAVDEGQKDAVGETENQRDLRKLSSDSSPNLLQSPLTQVGGVLGTPLYMSPEQHLGLKADSRTDQFAFCVVLYEALYGRRPFSGASMEQLKSEVVRQQVCVPSGDSEIPAWLWQIIRKGLSAKPVDRYPSIEQLLEDLEHDHEEILRKRRQSRRRNFLLISLIILTISLPIGVWYGLRYRTVQLCKEAEGEFDGVWDNTSKTSIQKAFLDTEKSFAQWTWERLEKIISSYQIEWMKMRSDVCEARWTRGTQSEELFDLRMSCLRKRISELGALTKVFSKADAGVVQKAVQASSSLTDIAICADEEALRSLYPPPKTAKARAEVAAIRDKLAEAKAFSRTGKYQDGLKLTKMLEQEAIMIKYPPVQAEVLSQLGELLYSTGDYKAAETTLYRAARMAGKSRDIQLVAKAMILRLFVVGHSQGRPEDGLLIGREAEIVVELGGGDDALRGILSNNMGGLFWRRGEYANAMAYYSNALNTLKEALGPEHPVVAMSLNNMGAVFSIQAEYHKALECHHKALVVREKVLGPEHPEVAQSLHNLGSVFQKQGEYEKALVYYRKSLVIRENALGPAHPDALDTLGAIGKLLVDQGRQYDALHPQERLVKICEQNYCDPNLYGRSLVDFAQALVATNGDKKRATKLAKQARDLYGKTPRKFKKELEKVTTWLQKHVSSKLAKKAVK